MKHETTTLNGANVRFYEGTASLSNWYVLADVAKAVGVSINGIKRHVSRQNRCIRPVHHPDVGLRDMIHVSYAGLRQWIGDGTGRLSMQKQCVARWLSDPRGHLLKSLLDSGNMTQATFADSSTIAPTMSLEKPASEVPEVQTIEWRQFWSDEHNGISLRAMVEAGLYARPDHAVRALLESEIEFSPVEGKTSRPGRPPKDYILTLNNAQRFCARANTPTGRKILDVMIEHHNEYQALLNGDTEAAQRLAAHVVPQQGSSLTQQAELILQMCRQQDAMRAQLEDLQRRQDELEAGRETPKAANEWYASQIARRAGWQTVNGRDHGTAISAIADITGAALGVDYRMYRELNPHSNTRGEYVSRLYSEEWVNKFLEQWRELYQRGAGQFTIAREGHSNINVYCTKFVRDGLPPQK